MGRSSLLFIISLLGSLSAAYNLEVHQLNGDVSRMIKTRSIDEDTFTIFCTSAREMRPQYIFSTIVVAVRSEGDDPLKVYLGDQPDMVEEEYLKSHRWFSFDSYTWSDSEVDVRVSPFNSSCVGVASVANYQISVRFSRVYLIYLSSAIIAIIVFFSASSLAHSVFVFYSGGSAVGVFASLLLLLFLISRLMPYKKAALYGLMASGSASYLLFARYLYHNSVSFALEYRGYIFCYVVISAATSFLYCYWRGPPSSPRTFDVLQWLLQGISLATIYMSVQIEVYGAGACGLLLGLQTCRHLLHWSDVTARIGFSSFWWRIRPPVRRLLSEEEYQRLGKEETELQLTRLREFAASPQAHPWTLMRRLSTPDRFASFVEGEESHISGAELSAHLRDPGPVVMTDDEVSDDSF